MPLLFGSWSAGGGALLALLAALVMAFSLCGLFLGCGGGCGLCGVSTLACGLSKRKASAQQQCAYNREQLLHSVSLWGYVISQFPRSVNETQTADDSCNCRGLNP